MNPLPRFLKSTDNLVSWLSRLSTNFGGLCAYIVTFMIILDILWRMINRKTIPGLFELVSMSVVILAYYGLPKAILVKRQLLMDIVSKHFKGALVSVYHLASNLFGAFLFGTIATYGWTQAWKSYTGHWTFGQSVLFPYVIPWTFLCIVMTINFLVSLREVIWYSIKLSHD